MEYILLKQVLQKILCSNKLDAKYFAQTSLTKNIMLERVSSEIICSNKIL